MQLDKRKLSILKSMDVDKKKLLYLIYLLTYTDSTEEQWLKDFCLSFLVYQAIKEKVFKHYDYAPALVWWHGMYRYANISREAQRDLLDFLSNGFVIRLELATRYYDTIEAYRIDPCIAEVIDEIYGEDVKKSVKSFLTCTCGNVYRIYCFPEAPCLKCDYCGNVKNSDFLKVEVIPYNSDPHFTEFV